MDEDKEEKPLASRTTQLKPDLSVVNQSNTHGGFVRDRSAKRE